MASNVTYFAIPSGVHNQGAIHVSCGKLGKDMNTREDFAWAVPTDTGTINGVLTTRLDHPRYYSGNSGI